jgi:hypothetical protein
VCKPLFRKIFAEDAFMICMICNEEGQIGWVFLSKRGIRGLVIVFNVSKYYIYLFKFCFDLTSINDILPK